MELYLWTCRAQGKLLLHTRQAGEPSCAQVCALGGSATGTETRPARNPELPEGGPLGLCSRQRVDVQGDLNLPLFPRQGMAEVINSIPLLQPRPTRVGTLHSSERSSAPEQVFGLRDAFALRSSLLCSAPAPSTRRGGEIESLGGEARVPRGNRRRRQPSGPSRCWEEGQALQENIQRERGGEAAG